MVAGIIGGVAVQGAEPPGDSPAPFLVRSWQTEQGLPHNMVLAIIQTHDGYLWAGTVQGLARFDGVNCKTFGLRDGLNALEISALLEDRTGALWIGTVGGGLSRYAGGKMQTFGASDGLSDEAVTTLLEDAAGEIWIGTTAGLYRRDGAKFSQITKGSVFVRAIAQDRDGAIWVSTLHNGLMCFRKGQSVSVAQPAEMRWISACYLLADKQGRLWAGLWGGPQRGVVLCLENGKWNKYSATNGVPAVYINSLAQTPDGTIWGGTLDEGLLYLQNGTFHSVRMKDGLSDDAICALFVGHDGNLWVGTRSGGLDRVSPKKLSVCRVLENSEERLAISLAQTTNGDLWVAASGRGIYRWDNGKFDQLLRSPPAAGHLFVGAVLGTGDGSLWWGAGPSLFQWQKGTIVSGYEHEAWLRGDRITALCEHRGGGIWAGTYNGQLQLLQSNRFTAVSGLPEKPISALVEGSGGTLWIGTMGGGAGQLREGKLTFLTTKNGLRSNLIRSLKQDPDGTLWIGTVSGGLARWAGGHLRNFTQDEGLIDDTILQILDDGEGNLWLGCNRGICRVTKQSLNDLAAGKVNAVHPLVFGIPEGMASEQCEANFASALKAADGRMLFCTAKGIVIIDPRLQTNNDVEPVVLMEDALVDGHGVPPSVGPGRHSFEFHYTGLNFSAPEKVRFRYRLDGLDTDWVEAGGGRTARYPYLPPGKYRFEVAACNDDGRWNAPAVGAAFAVLPYFWQTGWFSTAVVLLLLGLTAAAIRFLERRRYHARLARLQLESQTERERERIARDLHDELGSSLTRISMLSDLGQSRDNSTEQLKSRVEKISNFAVRTARSLDEIVWAVNPRNDSFRSLLEYLMQFAREVFEDTPILCRFRITEDLPQSPLPPEMRHNIFLAVKEALTNVLKHSQATEVVLSAQIVAGQLEISIQDDGGGFDPRSLETIGRNGLVNMRQRIEGLGGRFSIQTIPGRSTTISISLQTPSPAA
jgi:signal transduction histidine kinase/ligand-binding sensor domain-containing protein